MVTRIERPRSRACVALLYFTFLVVFIVLLGIGDNAPSVLLEYTPDTSSGASVDYTSGVNSYTTTFDLSRENQLFWLDLRVSTGNGLLEDDLPLHMEIDLTLKVTAQPFDGDSTEEVETFDITATQSCEAGEDWCDYAFVWTKDFVEHDIYFVTVEFPDPEPFSAAEDDESHEEALMDMESRVTSINPDFTRFEIGWKYFWFITTLLVMFCPCGLGFMSALKRRRQDTGQRRTYHQRWTVTLLWALLWFDDPFVAATVYTDWAMIWSAVFILSASIFVFLILLFWLCFLSDLRFMREGDSVLSVPRGFCYWLPKVVLTLAIGVTLLGGYMYYRFENTISFDYTGVADEKEAAEILAGFLGFMLAVYMLWVLLLVLTSCGQMRLVSPSYALLYCITLLSCLVAIIGVFVAAYYPYQTSELAFVSIHGLLNLYVWTLAVSFSPVREAREDGSLGVGNRRDRPVTGTKGREDDLSAWDNPTDSEFKAVEL